MSDWRNTDPEGCVHRFEVEVPAWTPFRGPKVPASTTFVCRRYPRQMYGSPVDGMGDRFPSCTARCGEYDQGPPPPIVLNFDTDENLKAFRETWERERGRPIVRVAVPEPMRFERNPGAVYGHPPAPEAADD